MMIPPAFNPKFKTSLCKHWMNTGNCTIGARCHFAHGQSELRNPNDPLPAMNQGMMQDPKLLQMCFTGTLGAHNYKTVLCRYHQQQKCQHGSTCHFAHSQSEIKELDDVRHLYVKVIVQQYYTLIQQQHLLTTGGQTQFTIKQEQVGNQIELEMNKHISLAQLRYLVQQLEMTKELKEEIKSRVRQAREVLEARNLIGAQKLLNEIVYRSNVPADEQRIYDKVMNDSAEVGNQIAMQYLRSVQDFLEEQANNLQDQYQKQAESSYQNMQFTNPYGFGNMGIQQLQLPQFN